MTWYILIRIYQSMKPVNNLSVAYFYRTYFNNLILCCGKSGCLNIYRNEHFCYVLPMKVIYGFLIVIHDISLYSKNRLDSTFITLCFLCKFRKCQHAPMISNGNCRHTLFLHKSHNISRTCQAVQCTIFAMAMQFYPFHKKYLSLVVSIDTSIIP